jgi:hypothetical protein
MRGLSNRWMAVSRNGVELKVGDGLRWQMVRSHVLQTKLVIGERE